MRALSIRQPYAELILRGEKRIEYRSRPTKLIGERFYIYAAKKWAGAPGMNRHDVRPTHPLAPSLNGGGTPGTPGIPGSLPTGVIVDTAVISHVTNGGTGSSAYEWHLTDVRRFKQPRKPKGRPQPVWFRPF